MIRQVAAASQLPRDTDLSFVLFKRKMGCKRELRPPSQMLVFNLPTSSRTSKLRLVILPAALISKDGIILAQTK